MTVAELIATLQQIEDQTMEVVIFTLDDDPDAYCDLVTEVVIVDDHTTEKQQVLIQ